jgi:hypothetical protein
MLKYEPVVVEIKKLLNSIIISVFTIFDFQKLKQPYVI